jgi:hypothetical protein
MIYYGEGKMPDLCSRRCPFHFATALILLNRMGVDLSRIDLLAAGEHEDYKGEVREQQPAPGAILDARTRITLKVGFPSAVDQTPYQFFYGFSGIRNRGAEWETHARELMAPFDGAQIRREATSRYESLKYGLGMIDEEHLIQYLQLFDFAFPDGLFDLREAVLWSSLLPTFHEWAGNAQRVAEVLTLMLGHRFRIVENVSSTFAIPGGIQYRLGSKSGRLGQESILGVTFTECDTTYAVVIGGIRRTELKHFLPGQPGRRKLDWMLGICMPSDLEYTIRFEVDDRAMIIGKQHNGAFLGCSTHL